MAQVLKHLPRKCEALSSNPSTEKKKEGRNKKEGGRRSNSYCYFRVQAGALAQWYSICLACARL
jgi:hypothetical protein